MMGRSTDGKLEGVEKKIFFNVEQARRAGKGPTVRLGLIRVKRYSLGKDLEPGNDEQRKNRAISRKRFGGHPTLGAAGHREEV